MSILDNLFLNYYDNGRLQEMYETDSLSVAHGINVHWDKNGTLRMVCYYVDGVRHGKYRDYYKNGKLWEESWYVNGKLHGPRNLWHDNGNMMAESTYYNDHIHGLYISWYENQDVNEMQYYVHGKDITEQIKSLVRDICNITPKEKTQIALQYGIVL